MLGIHHHFEWMMRLWEKGTLMCIMTICTAKSATLIHWNVCVLLGLITLFLGHGIKVAPIIGIGLPALVAWVPLVMSILFFPF